jgi:hypothetical protein
VVTIQPAFGRATIASVNLTEEQLDLLRRLVAEHRAGGGHEFLFVESQISSALEYRGGSEIAITNSHSDFLQLSREGLIVLFTVGANVYRGQPTRRGIAAIDKENVLPNTDAVGEVGRVAMNTKTIRAASSPPKVARSMGSVAAVEALVRLKERKGWTMEELAIHLDTTGRTLQSFFKTHKVRNSVFRKMAHQLNMTPEDLLIGKLPVQ